MVDEIAFWLALWAIIFAIFAFGFKYAQQDYIRKILRSRKWAEKVQGMLNRVFGFLAYAAAASVIPLAIWTLGTLFHRNDAGWVALGIFVAELILIAVLHFVLKDEDKREREVQIIAHRLWEEEGYPDGRAKEHWAKAEAIVDGRHKGDKK